MFKKFLINWSNLRGSNGKWRMGLMLVGVIGQLIVSEPGQCDCESQTDSDSCGAAMPSNIELYGNNGGGGVCQGSTSGGCAYCEWAPAYESYPAYCSSTASSSNCPPGVNGVQCSDDMGHARIKDKKSDVKTQKK